MNRLWNTFTVPSRATPGTFIALIDAVDGEAFLKALRSLCRKWESVTMGRPLRGADGRLHAMGHVSTSAPLRGSSGASEPKPN
jgi:hypothetical protein